MKDHFIVGVACLNQTPLDWTGNARRIRLAIDLARAKDVQVLCLPELCISGYNCEDAFLSGHTLQRARDTLRQIMPLCRGLVVNLGLPLLHRRRVYNVAALIVDGKIAGFAAKQFLAGEGVHYEPRWFNAWPAKHIDSCKGLEGEDIPIGDLTFDVGGVGLGFEICEDAWVADRPGIRHAARGVDLLLNPSASHFAFGKNEVRKRFVLEGSRAFHAAYLYSNLLGNESGRILYDGGGMIAARGELLVAGERFSFSEVQLIQTDIDLQELRLSHAASSRAAEAVLQSGDTRVIVAHAWKAVKASAPRPTPSTEPDQMETFTRVMTLGLFDYLHKSHSRGFVVSLSGGADSAAVACLVYLMVQRGIAELGEESFAARLGFTTIPTDWMRALLTTVYQATENSSAITHDAARTLAFAIGSDHIEWNIHDLVQGYVERCSQALARTLDWEHDDIALQNIQARARGPGVWMLANLRNALLLSTSNRSEAAVGYATMDGDTCGGLCPLAGIDKAFVIQWLRWLETKGPDGIGHIRALSIVNRQQPTAELRPAEQAQSDEKDLMPYDILDAIEKGAIRDKLGPAEVLERMQLRFPEHAPDLLRIWVVRFFRLWSRNQWKRERYAPGFHVDDENLDPKTWCRWPILSGSFAEELHLLEKST